MKKGLFVLAAVGLLSTGCGGADPAETAATDAATTDAAEAIPEATPAGVAIALVSPENASVPMGDAELVLQVVDPTTKEPVALDALQVDLSMPMDDMEPMTTMAVVEPGEKPGEYKVMTNLGMEGAWIMNVKSEDAAMPGEATFDLEVTK